MVAKRISGDWYKKSTEETLVGLDVSQTRGLSVADAAARLKSHGRNELSAAKKVNPLALFFSQFKDALIVILIVAAGVSLALSFVTSERTLKGEEKAKYYQELINSAPDDDAGQCLALTPECGYIDPDIEKNPDPVVQEKESPKEAILIFAIVVAIALIGFLNEYKAEKTVEALKKLVGQKTQVRRDGSVSEIDAAELVPGDIILLSEGQKIPADARTLLVKSLGVNEASLTGESLPVNKNTFALTKDATLGDRKNMLYAGTFVTTGTAEAVVVATGQQTELGKIADMVSSVSAEQTPMQRKLDELGKKLGLFIMIICAVVFVVVFFLVREAADKELLQRLIFAFTAAVALAVAAIPEGLAFVVRISLALGARRMAAKNALVRKLSAVEALGSTDIICSDKTGTLTRGEMTVRELWTFAGNFQLSGSGYQAAGEIQQQGKVVTPDKTVTELLTIGTLCNNAHLKADQVLGDPTEGAMLVSAAKASLAYEKLQKEYPRIDEIPFSSERKMMSTVHSAPTGGYYVATKGAVEVVLAHCSFMLAADGKIKKLTEHDKQNVLELNQQLAAQALRVLGFAYKHETKQPVGPKAVESELVFVGLQGIMDPPREEVVKVIHAVQSEAGLRVIMITGDYIETAKAIANEIGIAGDALSGTDLDKLSQAEFEARVEHIAVYARVNPEHKIRIVRALKAHGHQVAMTGDGVNDAPAIKAADIGIAMGITGTDAAKEAADLILLDDKFVTIIKAIEEGRGIFDNVRKFVNFLISCNIAEVLAILFGIIFFNNLILTAAQLLFINIVTDGLPAVALGSDPAQRDILSAKPKRFQQNILTRRVWWEIGAFGLLMTAALTLQYWYNHTREGAVAAVSAAFMAMVVYELVRLIDIRTDYKIKWLSNPWLTVAIASSFVLQLAVVYITPVANYFQIGPLSGHDWLFMGIGSVVLFVSMKLLNPVFDRLGPEH